MWNIFFRDEFLKSKVKIFPNHTTDRYFLKYRSTEVWYLLCLLIDKCWKNKSDFSVTTIYPFRDVFDDIEKNICFYNEKYFVFFLENFLHSNEYYFWYIKLLLDKLEKSWIKDKKIIIHSYKLSKQESKEIMDRYKIVEVIIRTDIEYFFNEILYKGTDIDDINNILYRDIDWNVVCTNDKIEESDINDYILWSYYSWYLVELQDDLDIKLKILKDDEKMKNVLMNWMKDVLISTWKWCLYNCMYCFRWVRFSKIRQISLDTIKKDLDYFQENWYKNVYLYDDCFLTTNISRIDEMMKLLNNYDLSYYVAIRYEMAVRDNIMKMLIESNINKIQIWLQTTNKDITKIIWRSLDIESFKNVIKSLKDKWKKVSIDLILWLPQDNMKNFINTFNFAVSLNPSSIFVNSLFLNPWTELYKNKEKYWIEFDNKNNHHSLHSVPYIKWSITFPQKDLELTRKYIDKVKSLYKNIFIMNR